MVLTVFFKLYSCFVPLDALTSLLAYSHSKTIQNKTIQGFYTYADHLYKSHFGLKGT